MKILKMITLMLLIAPSYSYAQGHSGAGGGEPNELASFTNNKGQFLDSWYSVKMDLIKGLGLNRHLELSLEGLSPEDFKNRFLFALQNAKVEFDDEKISVDAQTRPCENFTDRNGSLRIHCNLAAYKAAMIGYDAETQYKLVAHEYLGVSKIEPNMNGISDYPISSQISVHLSNVQVKKWGIIQSGKALIIGEFDSNEMYTLQENQIIFLNSNTVPANLSEWYSIEHEVKGWTQSDTCRGFGRITQIATIVYHKKLNGTLITKNIYSEQRSGVGVYSRCQTLNPDRLLNTMWDGVRALAFGKFVDLIKSQP